MKDDVACCAGGRSENQSQRHNTRPARPSAYVPPAAGVLKARCALETAHAGRARGRVHGTVGARVRVCRGVVVGGRRAPTLAAIYVMMKRSLLRT